MTRHPRPHRPRPHRQQQQAREPVEPTHDPTDPGYHDPGSAVPPGIPGPGSEVGDDWAHIERRPERDPGDAVPPGVAPKYPPPPTEEDLKVKRQLEELPKKARARERGEDEG